MGRTGFEPVTSALSRQRSKPTELTTRNHKDAMISGVMQKPVEKVVIIGAGRLAWSLIPALQQAKVEIVQLISRSEEKLDRFSQAYALPHTSTQITALDSHAHLILLTVPDSAISTIAPQLAGTQALVAHTSGSVSLDILHPTQGPIGVFYPLQTFTFSQHVDFAQVPMFIEGDEEVSQRLSSLAQRISQRVFFLDSQDRLRLHLGAVWACNFPNLLLRIAGEVLPQQPGIDIGLYESLVKEAIHNAFTYSPGKSQTGPAMRGDTDTLEQHLSLLKDHTAYAQLYRMMSTLINPQWETKGE